MVSSRPLCTLTTYQCFLLGSAGSSAGGAASAGGAGGSLALCAAGACSGCCSSGAAFAGTSLGGGTFSRVDASSGMMRPRSMVTRSRAAGPLPLQFLLVLFLLFLRHLEHADVLPT